MYNPWKWNQNLLSILPYEARVSENHIGEKGPSPKVQKNDAVVKNDAARPNSKWIEMLSILSQELADLERWGLFGKIGKFGELVIVHLV